MRNSSYFFEKFKIWSGCIVLFYVATHLLNHALGIFSLDALEGGREIFVAFWRSAPLNYVVVAALLLHMLLAGIKIVRRKSFRGLRRSEWAQILIGLLIPAALFGHVLFTKIVHEVYGINDTYSYYLLLNAPADVVLALLFTALVWWHGAIGLGGVLATRPRFEIWRRRLVFVAWGLPVVAAAGVVAAWHEAHTRAALDPAFVDAAVRDILALGEPVDVWQARLNGLADLVGLSYLATLGLVFAARGGVL